MKETKASDIYDHHKGLAPLLRRAGPLRFWPFFSLNLAGFIVACAFWQYLSSGRWAEFTPQAYQRDLAAPLGEVLIRPLGVLVHPWMIVATGLLLGIMILVPVIVSVLYRLLLAALFVVVVAVVGHAPVLAAAVAIGCVLAARTPLRSDMPFLAAFVGLIPAMVYLFVFGFEGLDIAAVLPLRRWILRVPFLVALVSAVLSAAVVLGLTRVTGFRPGVIWPVLAALLGGSILAFSLEVGPAELDYALICDRLGPGEAIIESVSLESWRRRNVTAGLGEQTLEVRMADDLRLRRRALENMCQEFLAKHPDSKQAPGVLWIQARCSSLQFDLQGFRRGWVRYTDSYPLTQSGGLWRRLREGYPASAQAALANFRLGQLAMRESDIEKADDLLRKAAERLHEILPAGARESRATRLTGVFSKPVLLPTEAYYAEALFESERLIWLIEQNDLLKDKKSADAMTAYLQINRCRLTDREYYVRLASLAGRYEGTDLADNLKLAVARATDDVDERVNQLVALAGQWSDSDAAIEANYELGQLVVRRPVLQLKPNMEKPETYFKKVIQAPPSPWQRRAAERLAWVRTLARPKKGL